MKTPSPGPELRFSRLLQLHQNLDELFLVHQELLLKDDLWRAREVLDAHRALFELHVEQEEQLLLPLYSTFTVPARFPAKLYTGQHRKMRTLLVLSRRRLESIEGRGSSRRRQVIQLLDHEATYKHLAEHHDGAERSGFIPTLELFVDATRQAELTERCLVEWDRLEKTLLQRVLGTSG